MHTGKSLTSCCRTKPPRSTVSTRDWLMIRMNFSWWLTAAIFKQQPSGLEPEKDAELGRRDDPTTQKTTHYAALPSLQLGPCILVVKICTGLQNRLAKRG